MPGRTGKQCRERWTSKVRASAQHYRPPPLPPSALAHGGKVTDCPRGSRPAARPERPAGAVVQAGGREADLLTSQVRSSSSCSKRARTHPPRLPQPLLSRHLGPHHALGRRYGGRWSKIARSLPGRSEAAARQRWAILSQTKLPNSGLPLEVRMPCPPHARSTQCPWRTGPCSASLPRAVQPELH